MNQFKMADDFGSTEKVKAPAKKKAYKLNDEVKSDGKTCKIVEVLEDGKLHLKNVDNPFDSFVVNESEIE